MIFSEGVGIFILAPLATQQCMSKYWDLAKSDRTIDSTTHNALHDCQNCSTLIDQSKVIFGD